MAANNSGTAALELRGICKRYGTGQGGQVIAADVASSNESPLPAP